MIIIRLFIFTVLINWCVSMQMLNQNLDKSRQKVVAVMLALLTGAGAAAVVLL